MSIQYMNTSGYINNIVYDDIDLGLLKTLGKTSTTFGVSDDFTFYKILKLIGIAASGLRINFYEFECMGLTYKGLRFKQARLRELNEEFKHKPDYCYSYGSYALQILTQLLKEGHVSPVIIDNNIKAKLREAYSGGRNEFIADPCKNAKLYSFDFNKMYFNCFKTNYLGGVIKRIETKQIQYPGFYYIKYESYTHKFPVLFLKNQLNGQNYFCNGIGKGLFGHEEIQLFMEEGGIIHDIYYVYTGDTYTKRFLPFTTILEGYRNNKLTKLLANNLYGKLAMKNFLPKYELLSEDIFILKNTKLGIKRWVKGYDFYICELINPVIYEGYTDICAAAAITSKARIKLYKLLKHLSDKAAICLLNTDEIIISTNHCPKLSPQGNVKVREIPYEDFLKKKNMFMTKRKIENNDTQTTAYRQHDGMLF